MDEQPPPAAPEPDPPVGKKLPEGARLAILVFGGLLLAIGGCGFFLNNTGPGNRGVFGGAAFVVGVIMVIVGVVTALIWAVQEGRGK